MLRGGLGVAPRIEIEFAFAKNPKIISSEVKLPHMLDQPANPSFKEVELIFEEK